MNIDQNLENLRADLRAVQARAQNINSRAQAIYQRVSASKRDLTADENRQMAALDKSFDAAEAEAESLRAAITEMEATPLPRLVSPNPIAGQRTAPAVHDGFAGPVRNWASMFPRTGNARDDGGFESFGAFARAVVSGNDSRLIRNASGGASTIQEGVSAGYLVPQSFVQRIMDGSLAQEVWRPRAQVVPVATGETIISGWKTTDQTGAKRAGLQLQWGGEAEDMTLQKPIAEQMTVKATKGSIFCAVSAELMEDAPNFDAALSQAMVASMAAGLDHAFISGTGAGQPLGVLNAPGTIQVAKSGGQAANTLTLTNLGAMVGRLHPASFVNSLWLVHPTVVPLLYSLAYVVRNVADTENVGGAHVQAVSHDANGALTIFGRPAVVTDAVAPLSSRGDIVLADPAKYIVAVRQDVRIALDRSHYFRSDEVAFKLTIRIDGQPVDSEATKLRDGSNTVSRFVVLEAR